MREATDSLSNADFDTTRWGVVVPSFNHAEDAVNCLASLRDAYQRPERVILVDDASTDDAIATIAEWAAQSGESHDMVDPTELGARQRGKAWLTIVTSKTNSGFSAACNLGLSFLRDHTDAPFILLLNNDAAVAPSYFKEIAAGIRTAPNVGLATGTIYEWDRRTPWYAGGRFNPLRAVAEHYVAVPSDGRPRRTAFISGCTMLISRAVLETVGLLPELYSPCYCEDADYCLNVARSGFELLYVPDANAYHRVSRTLGRDRSPEVIYWFNRNRGYAMRRNYSGWNRAGGIAYLALTKPVRALWELLRGRPRSGSAFIRGTLAGLFDPLAKDSSSVAGARR